MHILLTDILACPVCGPPFGLIVLADEMSERRVVHGALGCPNCERRYPVRHGIALLDPDEERIAGDTPVSGADADPEAAIRIAALLGLNDARGFALVTGPTAAVAGELAVMAENVEIIGDAKYAHSGATSRLRLGARLPFYDARLHGIWLSGDSVDAWIEEAARALHPVGRLVLEGSSPDHVRRLERAGLMIAAREAGTVLATKT